MALSLTQQLTGSLRDLGKRRINRAPSPLLAIATPWLLVMLGSLMPMGPVIASAPLVPPLGFLLLVAWQQLRPGLFPVWAGLPLGLFDDLFSGQPFGSAVLLWSASMIALDLLEVRYPWRGTMLNWVIASALSAATILAGAWLASVAPQPGWASLLPQIALAVLAYPAAAALVGAADRFRLIPIRKV